jgi:hypothetical protein
MSVLFVISFSNAISPKLKRLVGVVSLPEDFDEEIELRSALEKKHL